MLCSEPMWPQACTDSRWAWVVTVIWLSRPSFGHRGFHKNCPIFVPIVSQFVSNADWRQLVNQVPRLISHMLEAKIGFCLAGEKPRRTSAGNGAASSNPCFPHLPPCSPLCLPAARIPVLCQPQTGKRGWQGKNDPRRWSCEGSWGFLRPGEAVRTFGGATGGRPRGVPRWVAGPRQG